MKTNAMIAVPAAHEFSGTENDLHSGAGTEMFTSASVTCGAGTEMFTSASVDVEENILVGGKTGLFTTSM
ncbi:MAG: DUF6749 domain-containing protein [Paracoccaceae bacterium]|nr:DUF6749 domain-containing protein [Paracoccaceae bacterium]